MSAQPPTFALVSALLLAGGLSAQTTLFKCPCVDSVSVNRGSRNWSMRDNRIRAYTGTNAAQLDIHGLLKFDLGRVPDTATVFAARLVTTNEQAFGSPRNKPVVDLYYSDDDSWTRASASPKSAMPKALVAEKVIDFSAITHDWPLDLAAHDFKADLKDDRATLAVRNMNKAYSYVYFIGHSGSPTGPAPYLEIRILPGPYRHMPVGKGCPDSGTTRVAMTCRQGVVVLGHPVPLNVRVSPGLATTAVVTMGKYSKSWGGLPLPFPLTALGAPGCQLNCSIEVIFPALQMPAGGAAFEPMTPKDPVLQGANVFFQAIVTDPRANALGLATTNGVAVTLWQ
jgi:hypothetical protein